MMIKNYKKIIMAVLVSIGCFSFAVAADKLPEIMVGQTTVTQYPGGNEVNYYGGYTGNEVVYNANVSGKTTGKSLAPSAVFDGASSYVNAGTGPSITGTGAFTFSTWIKRAPGDSIGKGKRIILTQALDSGRWVRLMIEDDYDTVADSGDRILLFLFSGQTNFKRYSEVKILPTDTAWHHVVAVRKDPYPDGSVLKSCGQLWVDGVLQSYANTNNGPECGPAVDITSSSPGGIFIGKPDLHIPVDYIPGKYFKGNIDDVRIYNRALTSTEILQMYRGTFDETNKTNLKAHWQFNEGSGTNIADSSGNQYTAVFNNAAWVDDGPFIAETNADDLFGFNKDLLVTCAQSGMLANPDRCFRRNTSGAGSVTVMNSRTSINGTAVTETAALFYPPKTVVGDVYGSMDNFAFWGRNLHQASGTAGSDASWTTSNYPINPNAQAKWDGDEFKKNTAKITTLKGEAPELTAATLALGGTWYLQGVSGLGDSTSDALKYPEGKVWKVTGDLTIDNSVTFHGKGTIIVDGDLTINNGINISPAPTGENRLGFIVLGSIATVAPDTGMSGTVTMRGNNKIQASIYCPGTSTAYPDYGSIIVLAGNVELTGSFVARSFNITATNTRFYYDYALDSAWPPGFRFLNMPHPAETKQ